MIRRLSTSSSNLFSKPRASGDDPTVIVTPKEETNVNPARAGMIRGRSLRPLNATSKPRASGDDPHSHINPHRIQQ